MHHFGFGPFITFEKQITFSQREREREKVEESWRESKRKSYTFI